MLKWIKTLNKMYADNPWTDDGRVVVSYCADMDAVVVKVMGKYQVVEIDTLTDWGILIKIQDVVREMYEAS